MTTDIQPLLRNIKMSDKNIADILGIHMQMDLFNDPTKKINQDITITGDDEKDDYTLSRSTLRSVTEVGANALSELLTVAKTSQKARDYEVAATMMKTLADLTKSMKDLHKVETNRRISNLENENQGHTINVDKAVFVGTTAQLLHELRKKPDPIIEEK